MDLRQGDHLQLEQKLDVPQVDLSIRADRRDDLQEEVLI